MRTRGAVKRLSPACPQWGHFPTAPFLLKSIKLIVYPFLLDHHLLRTSSTHSVALSSRLPIQFELSYFLRRPSIRTTFNCRHYLSYLLQTEVSDTSLSAPSIREFEDFH